MTPYPPEPRRSEPIVLAPTALLALIAFMIGLHAYRAFGLGLFEEADIRLLDLAAFVPARFSIALGLVDRAAVEAEVLAAAPELRALRLSLYQFFVAEDGAKPWTLVSYAFLHGSWEHVVINGLWMLVFGAPVMRRFGAPRFLLFFAATAAAAAAFHALFNRTDVAALVGASGAVSGLTAAALRFAIGPEGFGGGFGGGSGRWRRPAAPLADALRDRRVLVFIAVWFGINLIAGLGAPLGGGEGLRIAWEAHVGGFLAGLLLFSLFDPVKL